MKTIDYNNVGRNDKCPCGSDKKYKKCCMNKKNEETASDYVKVSSRNRDYQNIMNEIMKKTGTRKCLPTDLEDQMHGNYLVHPQYGYIKLLKQNDNKEAFGNGIWEDDSKKHFQIQEVYIKKEYRGDGLGSKWMDIIIDIADKYNHGLTLIASSISYYQDPDGKSSYEDNLKGLDQMVSLSTKVNQNFTPFNHQAIKDLYGYYDNIVSEWEINFESDSYDDDKRETNIRLVDWYKTKGFVVSATNMGSFIMEEDFTRNFLNTKNKDLHMVRFNDGDQLLEEPFPCMLNLRKSGIREDNPKLYDFHSTSSFCEYLYRSERYDLMTYQLTDNKKFVVNTYGNI